MTESLNAATIAERRVDSLAESEHAVFGRVVIVHFKVAFAAQFEVEARMFCEGREHVVEEADAG